MSHNITTKGNRNQGQQTVGLTKLIIMSSLALLISFSPETALACGNIISWDGESEVIEPIVDCADPFKVTNDPPSPYSLRINGTVVADGGSVAVSEVKTSDILVEGEPYLNQQDFYLYRYEAGNYQYVRQEAPVPTLNDYREFAVGYFTLASEVDFYINILREAQETGNTDQYFYDEYFVELIDEQTGETIYSRYNNFVAAADSYLYSLVPTIGVGTYTMVIEDSELIFSKRSILQYFKDLILPTTFAQTFRGPYIYTITFTLTEPIEEPPTGASSVLFLPGIMGSRLYEDGNFCDKGEAQYQLWFSSNECYQMRLTTKFTGQSNNPIYTKPGAAGILDETFGLNIYKSFISDLKDWKDEDIIDDYTVVPYDWRAELDNVLKSGTRDETGNIFAGEKTTIYEGNLYNLIKELADNSKNGKVTVVAHSNGGLVIKQLISNLKNTNDPLLDVIDNVILVAVPQLGAPNAAIGILHGEDLDPVMSQAVTRKLMNTMPFSHHLLPVTGYFDTVDTPVIAIEPGEATDLWINTYGGSISTQDDLQNFLSFDSGRDKPEFNDLEKPDVVDIYLLNYAKTTEVVQGNFVPTAGMKVYQIAGVGLETPTSLVYFSDKECTKRSFFLCTEYSPKISYRVEMTIDGDDTVPVPSALALAEDLKVNRMWLDFLTYNNESFINRQHKDFFEVPDVSNFVSNIIQATNTKTYDYLSDSVPELDEGERLVFQLHSPLDMLIESSDGKTVSSSTNEIEGSVYRRFGELQYISIPADENATLVLNGLAEGSFTLDIEEVAGEERTRHTYSAIPSSTSTQVTLEIDSSIVIENSILEIDYDGDGEEDVLYNTSGVVKEEVTYKDLYETINNLGLKRAPRMVLLELAKIAEKFHDKAVKNKRYLKLEKVSLGLLVKQVILFERIKLISLDQRREVEGVITKLLNK